METDVHILRYGAETLAQSTSRALANAVNSYILFSESLRRKIGTEGERIVTLRNVGYRMT